MIINECVLLRCNWKIIDKILCIFFVNNFVEVLFFKECCDYFNFIYLYLVLVFFF